MHCTKSRDNLADKVNRFAEISPLGSSVSAVLEVGREGRDGRRTSATLLSNEARGAN